MTWESLLSLSCQEGAEVVMDVLSPSRSPRKSPFKGLKSVADAKRALKREGGVVELRTPLNPLTTMTQCVRHKILDSISGDAPSKSNFNYYFYGIARTRIWWCKLCFSLGHSP